MTRRFFTLDVFTDEPLAGNPLAVVLDADGLSDARMQAIAREFALSETVFVRPPADARHRAQLRIFTPARELPFAGHPTVGTAALIAIMDGARDALFSLEEKAGLVACVVETRGPDAAFARFRAPRIPERGEGLVDAARMAEALGLEPNEIAFSEREIEIWSAGTPFPLVPVSTLAALSRATPGPRLADVCAGTGHVFLYVQTGSHTFRARMFAPGGGIAEDPATGSAAAAFAGLIHRRAVHADGDHDYVIDQGVEMGRPSRIGVQLIVRGGKLEGVEISGAARIVSEGRLRL
jgi:trans-2,3-dihydro-3-hydroxyanthranilate isomerase